MNLKRIASGVAVLAVVGAVSACGSSGSTVASSRYPTSVESQFVSSCSNSGQTSTTECQCVLSKIEASTSLDQFMHDAVAFESGANLPSKYYNAAAQCDTSASY